jgi:hypothetical protein
MFAIRGEVNMKPTRILPVLAAFLFLTAFDGAGVRMGLGDGARRFVDLKDASGGSASGEVLIERQAMMPNLRTLGVTAYGLKPGSVYSVWYVNEQAERSPIGVKMNHFSTDGAGKGRYVTSVYEDVLDDWRYIDVMLHPDGNPKNTGGMMPALRGDLVYGYHS